MGVALAVDSAVDLEVTEKTPKALGVALGP